MTDGSLQQHLVKVKISNELESYLLKRKALQDRKEEAKQGNNRQLVKELSTQIRLLRIKQAEVAEFYVQFLD